MVIAAVNRSTPSCQNRTCLGPRRCATQNQKTKSKSKAKSKAKSNSNSNSNSRTLGGRFGGIPPLRKKTRKDGAPIGKNGAPIGAKNHRSVILHRPLCL